MRFQLFGLAIALAAGLTAPVQAVVVNGDFENLGGWGAVGSLQPPAGWTLADGTQNPVSQQAGSIAIGGSGTSALFSGNANGFQILQAQNFSSPWLFDFDFAAEDPGGDGGRTADLALVLDNAAGYIFMRVVDVGDNGLGDIQFHSGAGWTSVAALADSVVFSSDVTVAHSPNHIQLVSHLDQAIPTYDAILANGNGQVSALGLDLFAFGTSPNGGAITNVAFFESQTAGAEWLLDNVALTSAIPEPGSLLLLVTGIVGLLVYRRESQK